MMRIEGSPSPEYVPGTPPDELPDSKVLAKSETLAPASPGSYSRAPGAQAKQRMDIAIESRGIPRDPASVAYWMALIRQASRAGARIDKSVSGLQLFLIKDGWEGFMPSGTITRKYEFSDGQSATVLHNFANGDRVSFYNPITDRMQVENFDANDALVALEYDRVRGEFVLRGAFQILQQGGTKDYQDGAGWNGKTATVASPGATYRIPDENGRSIPAYPGISVRDGDQRFSDVHGYIGTHGCLMTSPLDSKGRDASAAWDNFATRYLGPEHEGQRIGNMQVVGY